MTIVCVALDAYRERLARTVPEVRAVVWDGTGMAPAEAAAAELLVPPYPGPVPTAAQLVGLPALRVVQLISAGYDGWTDLLRPDVTLCNGRGVHGQSTAELAVAGLLLQWGGLPLLLQQQRERVWRPHPRESARGKRVLVLGAGDIAERLATALGALGARSTLVGRRARAGVRGLDELPDLCAEHDALVIAVPLTDQTRGLVDAALLARLPDHAVVVNVARGPIVVTGALLAELLAGRLRAVLDVTDPEPLPPDHPLWTAPGVIVTPHVGGGAEGWLDAAQELVERQVRRYLAHEPLDNVVRPAVTDSATNPQ